jgi:hypothetical protein
MLEYAQKLDFEEEPDYEYLDSLLSVIKERNNFDDSFDWETDENKKMRATISIQNEDKEETPS